MTTTNQKIIATKGLPASGKTTWAKQMLADNPDKFKRVNKDDLRSLLDDGKWSKINENFVLGTRNYIIDNALSQGYSVIVDDTNLHQKHIEYLETLAKTHGISLEIKDFTDVPVKTCIERDLVRGDKSVGKKVILDMYRTFLLNKKEKSKFNQSTWLPKAIICDLDGTLAYMVNRSPYDLTKVYEDKVNDCVAMVICAIRSFTGAEIIFMSGREETCRESTQLWLKDKVFICDYKALLMRKEGDFRRDSIIKRELYMEHVEGKYHVVAVFDDRPQVIDELWRDIGLPVFDCGDGLDF